jgi:hypothetical protein
MQNIKYIKCLGAVGILAVFFTANLQAIDTFPPEPTNPVKILFDSKGTQTIINNTRPTNTRLATILGALNNFGQNATIRGSNVSYPKYIIGYTGTNRITDKMLADKDLYISLTRGPEINAAYTTNELNALERFVKINGKSILLHANHGPNGHYTNGPTNVSADDYTTNNAPLAARFGITLLPYIVQGERDDGYMTMTVNTHSTNSTNKETEFISNQAPTIASHDSCIIVPPAEYISIAKYPSNAIVAQYQGSNTPLPPMPLSSNSVLSTSNDFAILVHAGKGSVIVVGNSGMIADYGSPSPSFGLIPMQSNLMFFLNCVSYLTGDVNIPPAGQGPGVPGTTIPCD